jgi:hypothetical protein
MKLFATTQVFFQYMAMQNVEDEPTQIYYLKCVEQEIGFLESSKQENILHFRKTIYYSCPLPA